jgi:hypothetical protein
MVSIKSKMESPDSPSLRAEILREESSSFTFEIFEGDESLGEIDVESLSEESGFISGLGEGEKLNNGYLSAASLAVAEYFKKEVDSFKLFDIEDKLITQEN